MSEETITLEFDGPVAVMSNNRPEKHKLILKGLGLTRMHKVVILNDTPAIRGMIRKVSHLVSVEPAE